MKCTSIKYLFNETIVLKSEIGVTVSICTMMTKLFTSTTMKLLKKHSSPGLQQSLQRTFFSSQLLSIYLSVSVIHQNLAKLYRILFLNIVMMFTHSVTRRFRSGTHNSYHVFQNYDNIILLVT